jgi:hypothetical protein
VGKNIFECPLTTKLKSTVQEKKKIYIYIYIGSMAKTTDASRRKVANVVTGILKMINFYRRNHIFCHVKNSAVNHTEPCVFSEAMQTL